MYKLNLHCHSTYSDGCNSILEIANFYKENGFCCAVITDHYYPTHDFFMKKNDYLRQITEAERISREIDYPIICGIELCYGYGEEMVVFGTRAILDILDQDTKPIDMKEIRSKYDCATVLCHPNLQNPEYYEHLAEVLDGFEHYNHGQNFFAEDFKRKVPDEFSNLIPYSNSDAHRIDGILHGYNIIKENITTEEQLISFIKSKPKFEIYAKREHGVECEERKIQKE